MGTRERRNRSDEFDAIICALFDNTATGLAIAAVGSYGRGELTPGSDLDIVIVHDGTRSTQALSNVVNAILYPLWDKKIKVDHSVRTLDEASEAARGDLKVIMGLLDIRLVCGDPGLVAQLQLFAIDLWRREVKTFLPLLQESLHQRHELFGELAYLLEPDIKEARGGLRDITALRAIAISEAVKVPIERISQSENFFSSVREVLHQVNGRGKDRLLFQEQDDVARILEFENADALMAEIAQSARVVDYVMNVALHRLNQDERFQESKGIFSRLFKSDASPQLSRGLSVLRNEVVIDPTYDFDADPVIGVRAAATAAQLGLPLSLDSLEVYAQSLNDGIGLLPSPWPREAREFLIALIGAGESMIEIFEALDQEEILFHWIPEWRGVRSLPQRNALHRHTVDRHMVETAVAAASLTREVHRPDLLLFTALFHDIGKGGIEDHSLKGRMVIEPIAERIGFSVRDIATIQMLIEHHLLLSATATRRDLDDPATIASVAEKIPDVRSLELLHALSIADGVATGKAAWSDWKATLVEQLVRKTSLALTNNALEAQPEFSPRQLENAMTGNLSVSIEERDAVSAIELIVPDQTGLLSLIAGVLNTFRLDVRAARTKTLSGVAVMEWIVAPDPHAPPVTRDLLFTRISDVLSGSFDITREIEKRKSDYALLPTIPVPEPTVETFDDAATNATIIEVRSHDRPALLYSVGDAIAQCDIDIRSAIVTTLGAEAIDTLYVTEIGGGALTPERAHEVAMHLSQSLK